MAFDLRSIAKLLIIAALAPIAILTIENANPQITGEVGDIINVRMKPPDMSFFSADQINLKIDSTDDIFAAGSTIRVENTSADHLVIAGGEISIRDSSIQDLFAAGGKVEMISGRVTDDIVAAGGEVRVRPGFGIGGSAVIAGGDARIEAPVPVDLRVGAGNIFLNAAVGGDARLSGGTVTLGPRARIGGDLLYRTDNLVIQPGAVITGRRMILPAQDRSAVESWGRGAGELFGMFALAFFAGFTVLVVAIAIAVPGLMRSSAEFIRSRPLASLGIGVLVAIGVPLAAILLFASVIGVPLAMLLGAICLAITPVAIAATACLLGMEARRLVTRADYPPTAWSARLMWPALGAVVILALGMIPLLGLAVWLLAMLFGLGAIVVRGGRMLARDG